MRTAAPLPQKPFDALQIIQVHVRQLIEARRSDDVHVFRNLAHAADAPRGLVVRHECGGRASSLHGVSVRRSNLIPATFQVRNAHVHAHRRLRKRERLVPIGDDDHDVGGETPEGIGESGEASRCGARHGVKRVAILDIVEFAIDREAILHQDRLEPAVPREHKATTDDHLQAEPVIGEHGSHLRRFHLA